MHIERTGGLGGPGGTDPSRSLPRPGSQAADAKKTAGKAELDASTDVKSFAKLVLETPEVREDAVAEARKLLESGQLSTPDAIRRAAEAMFKRGI
jgi:hypothetical protein